MLFEQRLLALDEPHIRQLSEFRERLIERLDRGAQVPNFDPADGGVRAKTLLLLETPGRVARTTKFTSLDNPSATSRNLRPLVLESVLKRKELLMWNLVPWDIGAENKVLPTTSVHHAKGLEALLELLPLLRRLKAVVFFGAKAQVAMSTVSEARPDLRLLPCPHPSPTNLNTRPEARRDILVALKEARATADDA